MAKCTGKLFSDIKDFMDEHELEDARRAAAKAADREARQDPSC